MDSLVVEGLGKQYLIRTETEDRKTQRKRRKDQPVETPSWRERIRQALAARSAATEISEFWALKNVSFRVEPGTILGVIGPNGAGKSTLLKVIARVIAPTVGRVVGVGRVVSLLELGAGFDPDLSARENILMNAALLGVPRAEALRRTDDILQFAEMEKFSESPLKHYSSGMYLRLAFSVAVKMNPRILLADEILAVGDAAFQERCLQTVMEGGKEGLTVLFVSHDMEAIIRVCNRVVWINQGEIVKIGDPEEVVDEYQNATWAQADAARGEQGRHANRLGEILAVRMVSASGREIGGVPIDEDSFVKIRLKTNKPGLAVRAGVDVNTRGLLLMRSTDPEVRQFPRAGVYELLAKVPRNLLAEASYSIGVSCVLTKDDDTKSYPLLMYNAVTFMAYSSSTERIVEATNKLKRTPFIAPRLEWLVREEASVTVA